MKINRREFAPDFVPHSLCCKKLYTYDDTRPVI